MIVEALRLVPLSVIPVMQLVVHIPRCMRTGIGLAIRTNFCSGRTGRLMLVRVVIRFVYALVVPIMTGSETVLWSARIFAMYLLGW